jgi:hypothetical protein
MNHKQISWLSGALLVGFATLAVAATTEAATPSPDQKTEHTIALQASENQVLAHKMMGHINLAAMALDMGLPAEAKRQVDRATDIESKLAERMPELKLDSTFEYGKIEFDDHSTVTDHYMPVLDDVFLVSNYETIYKHADKIDVDEVSAGVMHLQVSVDLRDVKTALDEAQSALDSGDHAAASAALDEVFRNAVVDEEEVDDPKLLIAENLSLAKAFVAGEQYDSARLTLKHVQDRLDEARSDPIAAISKASLDEFSAELDEIQADLRMKDPNLLQRVSHRLDSWGDTISGWFS